MKRRAPHREIGFGFVFVRAVRAGEAKLRGRARGKCPAVAEARPDQMNLFRLPGARGVPPVSRGVPPVPANGGPRCPAGVPPVSRCR